MGIRERIAQALNPADFAAWLGGHETARFESTFTGCGIACYLLDYTDTRVYVSAGEIRARGAWPVGVVGPHVLPTPEWAARFIHEHDAMEVPPTAPVALRILTDICGPFPPQEFVGVAPFVAEGILQPA